MFYKKNLLFLLQVRCAKTTPHNSVSLFPLNTSFEITKMLIRSFKTSQLLLPGYNFLLSLRDRLFPSFLPSTRHFRVFFPIAKYFRTKKADFLVQNYWDKKLSFLLQNPTGKFRIKLIKLHRFYNRPRQF